MRKILYTVQGQLVAIVEMGKLIEVMLDTEEDILGNIYLGRVESINKELGAAFVDIGLPETAYLRQADMLKNEKLLAGQYTLVQIKQNPANEKRARVTCNIEFTGKYVVYFPFEPSVVASKKLKERAKWIDFGKNWCTGTEGVLFRSQTMYAITEEVQAELEGFRQLFHQLQTGKKKPALLYKKASFLQKVLEKFPEYTLESIEIDNIDIANEARKQSDTPEKVHFYRKENMLTHYGLDIELEKATSRTVVLETGGNLLIEEMETLTVIDVNSASNPGQREKEANAFATNKAAIPEIARQIRLRNLGGIILVDFLNMKDKQHQAEVIQRLKMEVAKDERDTRVYGFTRLGLLEISRQRTGKSLKEQLG